MSQGPEKITKITAEEVQKTALLARLELDDNEVVRLTRELDSILGYMESLAQIDVRGVEPTTHAVPVELTLRDDVLERPRAAPVALRRAGRCAAPPRRLLRGAEDHRGRRMSAPATELGAAELAAAIRARRVSARDATDAFLKRIASFDGGDAGIGSYYRVDAEGARVRAALIDGQIARGEEVGPLAGVPIALKDLFVTKGIETTAGSQILAGWIPPYDGTVVRKLEKAGRHHAGQDVARRVRHGLVQRELGVRNHAQPVGFDPRARRLVGRLGGPPSLPTCAPARSAPTPAARSGSRRRSAASPASSRPTAGSLATASSPSPARSISRARSAARPATARSCSRSSPASIRTTPPRSIVRCPTIAAPAPATSAACASACPRAGSTGSSRPWPPSSPARSTS